MCKNVHNVGERTNPTGLLTYISNNVLLRTCTFSVCIHMYGMYMGVRRLKYDCMTGRRRIDTEPKKKRRKKCRRSSSTLGGVQWRIRRQKKTTTTPSSLPPSHRAWAEWPASKTPQGLYQKVSGTSSKAHDTRTDWAPVVLLAQGGRESSPGISSKS